MNSEWFARLHARPEFVEEAERQRKQREQLVRDFPQKGGTGPKFREAAREFSAALRALDVEADPQKIERRMHELYVESWS